MVRRHRRTTVRRLHRAPGIQRCRNEPDWGSIDSHEAVPLVNGKPEREAFAFVDERSCVGCNLCAAIAPATFYMEEEHGMARIYRQHGDAPEVIEEAKAACPVGCIKDINSRDWSRPSRSEGPRPSITRVG